MTTATTKDRLTGPPRSTFVTAVAWLFIVVSACATPVALAQRFVVLRFLRERLTAPTGAPRPAPPAVLDFFLAHLETIWLAVALLFVYALLTAVGLLKRKPWARTAFFVLLLFGIVGALAGFALQSALLSELSHRTQAATSTGVSAVLGAMRVLVAGAAVLLVAVLAWLIVRMRSPSIRDEFRG